LFLGKTLGYTAQRIEESLMKFLLWEDGLLTGLVKKCRMMKAFLWYDILQVKESFDQNHRVY
jgi:hypothetical protein